MVIPDGYIDGGYVSKISAVNTETATEAATSRLSQSNNTYAFIPGRGMAIPSKLYIDDFYEFDEQVKPSPSTTKPEDKYKKAIPTNYKWNLVPHDWSLPTRAVTVDPGIVGTSVNAIYQKTEDSKGNWKENIHGLRRGRIWFWDAANAVENIVGGEKKSASAKTISEKDDTIDAIIERYWGFQFLWNPETIQSNLVRNMDITPSSADSLRVVSGAFPGQESFSVNIVLDRVNDFACARAAGINVSSDFTGIATSLDKFKKYYSSQEFPGSDSSISFSEKLTKVLSQGTMADLEYLFKAINGTLTVGGVSKEWSNLLGKRTANIGYLQPSLMGFQFGPTLDGLAWVGWISNIQINHTMFTEAMIPLRTEVSISAEAFTGSGIGAATK